MNFADQEEIAERRKSRGKKRRNNVIWNTLTVLVVLASLTAVGYFSLLFANPASSLNPFPPPTMPVPINIPTATMTPILPTATFTSIPVITTLEDETVIPTEYSATVEISPTATTYSPIYLFTVKGSPVGMSNLVFHPSLNCNWQGVAGKVTDIQGKPVDNLYIRLTGTYNGQPVDKATLSGGAKYNIGDGGYEIVLEIGSAPIASSGLLTIQLMDSSTEIPLSAPITFDTYSECDKNLILINFQQSQ
jgi:hypothetical protein